LDPEYGVGDWIWTAETHDQQTCRFWRRVDIAQNASVARAQITITADNYYHLFVDGREIGQGVIWYNLTEYDLTQILGPGTHILAVECFNEYLRAGLVAGLRVQMQDGSRLEVRTDDSWKIVPNDEKHWTTRRKADPHWAPAVVQAKYREWKLEGRTPHTFRLAAIQPITVTFWQSTWFHFLMLSICAVLASLCLWLLGRLALYSRAQQVVGLERARIARDIHDDLTAGLTQLALFGEVARSGLPQESEARRQVAKVCEKARNLSQAMNEIIWMVNSQRDTFRDFTSYVCKYAETFFEPTPIRCRFDIEEEMPDLPCNLGVRRNLFLGVKEALNNALRHSGASELLLRIHCRDQQMVVAVEDNGKGFDPVLAGRQGNGLSNMRTRAKEAGGVCRISSEPAAGCRVEFAVALARVTGHRLKFWRRWASARFHSARVAKPASDAAEAGGTASSLGPDEASPAQVPAWRRSVR
jgi:two-component sensor histidine kinase